MQKHCRNFQLQPHLTSQLREVELNPLYSRPQMTISLLINIGNVLSSHRAERKEDTQPVPTDEWKWRQHRKWALGVVGRQSSRCLHSSPKKFLKSPEN